MKMSYETAVLFFSILFNGQHHIPGKVQEYGWGWCVNMRYGSMATYDYNYLTKVVVMSHKYAIRSEIKSSGPGMIKICIWQRNREGGMSERHPTMEAALADFKNLPEHLTQIEEKE